MKRLGLMSLVLLAALYGLCGPGFAVDATFFPNGGSAGPVDFADDGGDFGPFPGERRAFMSPEYHGAMNSRVFGLDGLTIGNRVTEAENEETVIREKGIMPHGLDASVSQEWVRRYRKKAVGQDYAVGLVVDALGNTVVTGTSEGFGRHTDIATIKYDPDGKVMWTKRYNGTGGADDYARAIAVDGNGNVYVTGQSEGNIMGGSDYVTLKYNPDGKLLWVNCYHGPGNGWNSSNAITVDGNGNVYVTGGSDGGSSGYDYATLKYDPDGKLLWENRYNGPTNGQDYATAIALDGNGNVYVSGLWGVSVGGIFSSGHATLKYDPEGKLLWEKCYNWTVYSGNDFASAIAVDSNGNVYVTGVWEISAGYGYGLTLKYDPEGELLWKSHGPLGQAIVVDGNGNAYVTGSSGGGYATLKYNPEGKLLWKKRYNGSGNNYNFASAIAVDGKGNVYVTGMSYLGIDVAHYATLKYDPEGKLLWKKRYNGPANGEDCALAIAVDGKGNVYVTGGSDGGGSGRDYATLKYDPDGRLLWENRYNGPSNGWDSPNAIAADGNGNVYVTGLSDGGSSGYNIATLKYGPDKKLLWVNRYGWGEGAAIAVDGKGNVYVTGWLYRADSYLDYITLKYDPDGKLLWENRYDGPGSGEDSASAIAVDGNGNVYITGHSYGGSSGYDYATLKYDPDGKLLWENRYDGPGSGEDFASAIAVDGNGNVYITGHSYGGSSGSDYATLKYDSDGKLLWVNRYNGPGNSEDRASAMAVDGNGNVYVAGGSHGGCCGLDFATLKYGSDGKLLWVNRYNGPGNSEDRASAMALDGNGNVYVTGGSHGGRCGVDYATLKYDPDGKLLWVNRYNGPGNGEDRASAMALDGNGNVYVTGGSYGGRCGVDYATLKYDPDGKLLWESRYNGPGNGRDKASAIAVGGNGNVYVTGESKDDYLTIKYSQ